MARQLRQWVSAGLIAVLAVISLVASQDADVDVKANVRSPRGNLNVVFLCPIIRC